MFDDGELRLKARMLRWVGKSWYGAGTWSCQFNFVEIHSRPNWIKLMCKCFLLTAGRKHYWRVRIYFFGLWPNAIQLNLNDACPSRNDRLIMNSINRMSRFIYCAFKRFWMGVRHFKMYLKEKFGWIRLKSALQKRWISLFFINLVVDNFKIDYGNKTIL